MTLTIFIIAFIYFLLSLVLAVFIRRVVIQPSARSTVSLIVPAKDEADALPHLFKSLEKMDYPQNRLELVLINHRSGDETLSLMEQFRSTSRFPVKIVSLGGNETGSRGKSEALLAGVKEARGEIFVFTDAEARFGADWVKNLVGLLEQYDMAGGAVVVEGESLFARLQRLDWFYLCAVGAGFSGLKLPQSLFGKNMALKSELYQRVGGFSREKVWTEDLDLVKRCIGKGNIVYTLAPGGAVFTLPAGNWGEFFRQRLRWLKGGTGVGTPGMVTLISALLMDIALIGALFVNLKTILIVFLIKMAADALLLSNPLKIFRLKSDWFYLPMYSLFSTIYHLVLTISSPLARKLRWR